MLTKSVLIYMVAMAAIFFFIGQTISTSTQGGGHAIENLDTGGYSTTLVNTLTSGAKVVYDGTDDAAARQALAAQDGVVLIVIPADFSSDIGAGAAGDHRDALAHEGHRASPTPCRRPSSPPCCSGQERHLRRSSPRPASSRRTSC